MTIETTPWNAAELLETPADIAAYLDAYLEDGTTEELLGALNTIARSRGSCCAGSLALDNLASFEARTDFPARSCTAEHRSADGNIEKNPAYGSATEDLKYGFPGENSE